LQSAQILDLLELSRPDNLDGASKDAAKRNAALAARRDAQDGTNPHFITFASFRPSLRTITGFL
jgi:hypothetical protein